jgi:hypothetical protein
MFASAKQRYIENYTQYVLTGQSSYRTAYESAKDAMEREISRLQHQVDTRPRPIRAETPVSSSEAHDRLREAKLRASMTPVTDVGSFFSQYRTQVLTLATLGGLTLVLPWL